MASCLIRTMFRWVIRITSGETVTIPFSSPGRLLQAQRKFILQPSGGLSHRTIHVYAVQWAGHLRSLQPNQCHCPTTAFNHAEAEASLHYKVGRECQLCMRWKGEEWQWPAQTNDTVVKGTFHITPTQGRSPIIWFFLFTEGRSCAAPEPNQGGQWQHNDSENQRVGPGNLSVYDLQWCCNCDGGHGADDWKVPGESSV